MKKTLLTFAALLTLLATSTFAAKGTTFTLKESKAPTLHVKEVENGVLFKEYKGKVVLLNFFGKHCKWCMKEIPELVDLQKKYKKDFQVVAIHAQEPMTPGERSRLDNRFHFNYPIYESDHNYDFTRYIAQRAGWSGSLPFSVVFDRNGSAVRIIPGYAPKETLEHMIKVLTQ